MLRRALIFGFAALCACGSAFADPGDGGWRGRWAGGGAGGRGGSPPHAREAHPGGARPGEMHPHGGRDWAGRTWGAGENAGHGPGRDERDNNGGWRPQEGRRWGPDDARAGVRAGRLRPLADIMGDLQRRFGGRLLGQELGEEGPRTVYRIRWMTADGRRLDLVVDAESR